MAAGAERIRTTAGLVALAVVLHNGLGLALGWGVGRLFRVWHNASGALFAYLFARRVRGGAEE